MLRALLLVVAAGLVSFAVVPANSSENGEPGLLAALAEAVGVELPSTDDGGSSSKGQLYYQYTGERSISPALPTTYDPTTGSYDKSMSYPGVVSCPLPTLGSETRSRVGRYQNRV